MRVAIVLGFVLLAFSVSTRVLAAPSGGVSHLSPEERKALLAGAIVKRPLRFQTKAGKYVGGVSYQLVPRAPETVLSLLEEVPNLIHALPRTRKARLLDRDGPLSQVELEHGKGPFSASYTVHMIREPGEPLLRFWLDKSHPHDIQDLWGFFRVTRFSRGYSLITVAVALDLGPGLIRMLFEDGIERMILATPRSIRDFATSRGDLVAVLP